MIPAAGSFCHCEILLIRTHRQKGGGNNDLILVGVLESSVSSAQKAV